MYVEPLALFIIGEVVVVIIIIMTFLFYKSRLLRVLLAIWHEMRLKRLRHDSPIARQLAQLKEENRKFKQQLEDLREGGAETYAEQLQARLEALADQEAEAHADDEPEPAADDNNDEESHRTRAILRAFYEFEATRADPEHKDILAAEDTLLEQLKIQLGRDPDEEESEYVQGQTARLLERVAELEPLEQQHAEVLSELEQARKALNTAEGKAAALKSIQNATKANDDTPLPPPGSAHEDELYRLKCERFDMMESINKLRLQLQKVAGDGETSDLIEMQNEQMKHQEKYIKDTDVAFQLMEEDLATARAAVATLEAEQAEMGGPYSATDKERLAAQQESKDTLAGYAEAQQQSMDEMRENLIALRKAEKLEDREALLHVQEERLAAMARAIEESDTCVAMMEQELHQANVTIEQLKAETPKPKDNQDDAELETMLQQFMADSQDLVECLKSLEKQNEALRQRLLAEGVSPEELPAPPQAPNLPMLTEY
ncbi:MAG: hypothetical protein WEB07_03335 [Natronospirillum sp.]